MSRDVKIGMLIGLGFVIVGVVVISTLPEGSVEKRLMNAKADDRVQPVEPPVESPGSRDEKSPQQPPPVKPIEELVEPPPVKPAETAKTVETVDPLEKLAGQVVDHVASPPVDTSPRIHIVQSNENLSTIAKLHYGDANKWQLIADANKNVIKNVNSLSPGMRLVIPRP